MDVHGDKKVLNKDLFWTSKIVRGAENTAITLESIFKLLILSTIMGIDIPSGPIALPPNLATTNFVMVQYQNKMAIY